MKRRLLCAAAALTVLTAAIPAMPVNAAPESALLDVSGFRVMDENLVYIGADYLNPASVLFDDQDKVPASPDSLSVDKTLWDATNRSKNWKPNWQAEFGEDSFIMDLGANYHITGICYLDTNGVNTWTIESGEPFQWQQIGTFTTDQYQVWRGLELDSAASTRYLRFSTVCGESGVAELAIYGYRTSELSAEQKAKTAAKPSGSQKLRLSAGQRIGFNAFIDDPMTAIMAAGNVREYHNLSWLLAQDGSVKFTQGSWGDMDAYYGAMNARGISIIPCFQGGSSVISGGTEPPEIPVAEGADPTDAASYAVHAQAMYQVAARYGSNKDIDLRTLNVAEGSEAKTGLGYLQALENCNEPNKTWAGKANYFSPYELAAMCSADYDGHEGMIENAGVKQADPDFRLAMGGLLNTGSLLDYLSEMKLWFDYHRTDGKFAVDIINVHLGPDALNPEDSSFAARVKEIQKWISENAPDTELWISEFEIPRSDCEKEGVDNHDNAEYQLKYAQRVARTYLMAINAGVDRMTKFQLRDEGEGVYYNSGLVTGKGAWSKKPAWYAVSCMTSVLKDTYFAADMTEDEVKKYFFIDQAKGDSILCLWLPTNEGKTIPGYQLSVPETAHIYLTVPEGYAEGTEQALTVKDGKISVDISEMPVFVTISSKEHTVVNGKGQYLKPKQLALTVDGSGAVCDLSAASASPDDAVLNQCYRMFDEPDRMPQMIYGDTAGLKTPETNVNKSGITCYVTFDQPCAITGFMLFDTYGTGDFTVMDAETGTVLYSYDMGSYMARACELLNAPYAVTSKLKIVKGGGDLNEFAVYGYPVPQTCEMDVTGDGIFDAKDAAALCRWLTEGDSSELRQWNLGDCNRDGKLTAVDLTLMKQALLAKA